MSANNFYFAKEIDGKWYGWEDMAEESVVDDGVRTMSIKRADATADTLQELERKLDEICWYCEYGLTTQPYLPKDGTPIEVIE